MRKFLDYKLSGREVMWPIWGLVILWLVASLLYSLLVVDADAAATVVDGAWGLRMLAFVALAWGCSVAASLLLFPLCRKSMEAAGMDGERVETTYDFGEYVKLTLVGSLLTVVTLGIYSPWYAVKLTKFFLEGASWRLKYFGFFGKPMSLFAIVTLGLFLPVIVLSVAMGLTVGGYPEMMESETAVGVSMLILLLVVLVWASAFCMIVSRWMLRLSVGDQRLTTDLSIGRGTMFLVGQTLLCVLTLGLYAPMMELRYCQYLVRSLRCGESEESPRLGMVLRGWSDWGFVILQLLLVAVTLGIYLPWYYGRILSRFVPRIYVEDGGR